MGREIFPSGEMISGVFDILPPIDLMGSDADVRLWENFAVKRYENLGADGQSILDFYQRLIELVNSGDAVAKLIADEMWELSFAPITHILVARWDQIFTFSPYNSWGNIDHHWRNGRISDNLYREMEQWLDEETEVLRRQTGVQAIEMIPFNASLNSQFRRVEVTDICKNVRDIREYV